MKIKVNYFFYIYILIWFVINIIFLTKYPFVHSDESWLSGLSRSMIEDHSLSTTESFFDLNIRNPHAIKILFHILQIVFIKIFGYTIFSMRLISLIFASFSLILLRKVILKLFKFENSEIISFLTVIWLSLDSQFIYISHFARQEIILIFFIFILLNIILNKTITGLRRGILTGLFLGISVGFHPNSFIIAWPIGLYLLLEILRKKRTWRELLTYILVGCIIASIFIGISFSFNTNFIQDYSTFGKSVGVLDSYDIKVMKLPQFYKKLFFQINGTYHTPNIKVQILLFPILLIVSLFRKKNIISFVGFLGINIGFVFIGKYSQPSISLLIPFYYITSTYLTELVINMRRKIIIVYFVTIIGITLFFTINEIKAESESYDNYVSLLENIPKESNILCNIINDYVFPKGNIYSWRNLQFLDMNNMSLDNYITDRHIEYIIVPEELYYIYKNRPYWNVVYGNLSSWYPQLVSFTENKSVLLKEFESSSYGMRISSLRYTKPWYVKIYKVTYNESIIE